MRKTVLIFAALLASWAGFAQTDAFLTIGRQDNVKLPWGLYNLSVVDGRLYGCSEGMMMTEVQAGDYVWAMVPDTMLKRMHEGLQYVVRNPRDGHLYFCVAVEGTSQLYVREKDKGWLGRKNKRVQLHGWTDEINHPTFSSDGGTMIFSSRGKGGFGGYDLWCSRWNGKEWGAPFNLGPRINSSGNEIHPAFYNDYLLFSSDGQEGAQGIYNIYATRVRTGGRMDDIIFDKYIVQRLPEPLNSTSNDWEMAVDNESNCGYWISFRTGREELYGFKGRLDGVMLWGTVSGSNGKPLPGANVVVTHEGRKIGSAQTDADGIYHIFVQPDVEYAIRIEKPDYFTNSHTIQAIRTDNNALISMVRHDVQMESLPLDSPMRFSKVFGPSADVTLEPHRLEGLMPVINFLRDNPTLHAHFTLTCDQTTDKSFNSMLTEQRINSLRMYISSLLPSGAPIFYHNGTEKGENRLSASGENILTVILQRGE